MEEEVHRRTPAEYDYHCSLLQGPLASADSTTYGINYCSALNRVEGFHAVGGQIPQDIMHVLFEGVLHLEVKLMLKHFIVDMGYFTLETLRVSHQNHSHQCILLEKEKESCHFQVTIVYKRCWCTVSLFIEQSLAAQMWTFVILLPLLVGDLVHLEQPHWECFLLLLQIVKQCTAKVVSASSSGFIKSLVYLHHSSFKACYPGVALTPKMHYMVHFSSQLLE